ncbi:MAG: transketolase C-terminal domain-containing protein, partial [Cellulosimicrobium funkei]
GGPRRVLLVGLGSMARVALDAGESLTAHGVDVTVASPTWVLPMPSALVKLAGEHDLVVTVEDGVADGGVGALLAQRALESGVRTPVHPIGLPAQFLDHATRDQVVSAYRLTGADVARDVLDALAALARG